MSHCYQDQNGVSQIHRETNTRIFSRNIPSQTLQPYVDVRPVMTKYSHFPIVDPRKSNTVPLIQQPTFSPQAVFNPGNDTAPWSGFASSVNVESELRNQIYALQKCSQAVFVPSSKSELYVPYQQQTQQQQQPQQQQNPHALLFQAETFQQFNPNPDTKIVGSNLFMNPTRVQVKDLPKTPNC